MDACYQQPTEEVQILREEVLRLHAEIHRLERLGAGLRAAGTVITDHLRAEVSRLQGQVVEVPALHEKISRLRVAGKTVIAQRETWKARALAAETKFVRVKRLLAKELHPDYAGTLSEKPVLAEIFKRIWPQIEAIAAGDQGTGESSG